MPKSNKDIRQRLFSGSFVPVGSRLGSILINSKDSKAIAHAVRAAVKGESESLKLSEATVKEIEAAELAK